MAQQVQQEPTGFQYKFVENVTAGLRKDMRSDSMPDGAAVTCKNVTLRDGVMSVDKGYAQFLGDFRGIPQLILDMDYPNGTSDLILVTTDTIYERISGEWNYAIDATDNTNIAATTLSAEAASAQKDVVVASATGFSPNDHVGVRYKISSPKNVASTTKGTTTTYTITGEIAFVVGNIINVAGYGVAGFNVSQTVESVTQTTTLTTIVTNLNSSAFANTDAAGGQTRTVERSDQTLELKTTIASIASTTFTLADNLPGRSLKGARIVKAPVLSGSVEYVPDYVFIPSWRIELNPSNGSPTDAEASGALVVTNNMETPLVIAKGATGVTIRKLSIANIRVSPYSNSESAVTSFIPKTVELFNEKLCFGRTNESGTAYNNRIRMSASTLFEDFRSDAGGEVYDILEGDSTIQTIKVLRNLLLVYKRRSVLRGDYIGSVDFSTRFQTTIANEGAISTHAVANAEGKHYVVGTKDIYMYDGGPKLIPIGAPIREDLYTPDRFANINMKEYIQTVYDPEFQELHLFYPEGVIKGVRKSFRFHEQYKAWSARNYTHYFTYANMSKSVETLTWNDLRSTWSTYNQPWTSAFFVSEKLHRFLLGESRLVGSDGTVSTTTRRVYDQNQVKETEDTFTIYWQFDSRDFYLPNKLIRVDFVDLDASGDDVSVWWSSDLGEQWYRVKALEARDALRSERVHINKAAHRLRFRLKGGGTNFQLGWFGFSYIPEFSW